MPESNLDVVRRGVDAFKRGDLAEWIDIFEEDAVWVPAEMPDMDTVHGKVEILELMRSYLEPWDRFEIETVALEEHGERVLWTCAQTVSQKDSGLEFETEVSAVFDLRDGHVTRVRFFWDDAEARKEIGVAA
jgi:ketosteroid isomerase-like protein